MKILSLDYGTKHIGMAKWNSEVDVVLPFGVANNLDEIIQLAKQEKFDKIVVGMPYSAQNKNIYSSNTERVIEFIKKLKDSLDIEINTLDERFSSQQADRMGGEASRDEKSAMVILEGYLAKNKIL